MTQFNFEAIGTRWKIDIYEELSSEKEGILFAEIRNRIDAFDKVYSRFRADSLVTEISKKSGEYVFPEDANELFSVYRKFYDLTGGLFTPLIGNVMEDAGYDAKYSLQQKKELTKPPEWNEVMIYENQALATKKPLLLDVGAAGKGYLIDLVGKVIKEKGIRSYCVDAGGDILYRNIEQKTLPVGLEHPEHLDQAIGIVEVCDGESLCGSAGNRRAWRNFHHIINPESLVSPRNILAVWVVAENTIVADAITTCLFFVDPEKIIPFQKFEYLILFADFSITKSVGFNAEVFT